MYLSSQSLSELGEGREREMKRGNEGEKRKEREGNQRKEEERERCGKLCEGCGGTEAGSKDV